MRGEGRVAPPPFLSGPWATRRGKHRAGSEKRPRSGVTYVVYMSVSVSTMFIPTRKPFGFFERRLGFGEFGAGDLAQLLHRTLFQLAQPRDIAGGARRNEGRRSAAPLCAPAC